MGTSGLIFDIQRFSLHDGPGIRTTVFLKGCSLKCFWCHNPEGISPKKQIQFIESRCIACGACVVYCPNHAQQFIHGKRVFVRDLCQLCGECVQYCYADALVEVGRSVDVEEVMREVKADQPFYAASNGGVTLSGGEPALQVEFAEAILAACRVEGIHTAVETCANVSWTTMERLMLQSDLVMIDLKILDDQKHRAATGVSNKRILENVKHAVRTEKPLVFRTPVIPSVNDRYEDILAIAGFIASLKELRQQTNMDTAEISWELLPFHKLAADKYRNLGMAYQAVNLEMLTKEKITELSEAVKAAGVPAKFTGELR